MASSNRSTLPEDDGFSECFPEILSVFSLAKTAKDSVEPCSANHVYPSAFIAGMPAWRLASIRSVPVSLSPALMRNSAAWNVPIRPKPMSNPPCSATATSGATLLAALPKVVISPATRSASASVCSVSTSNIISERASLPSSRQLDLTSADSHQTQNLKPGFINREGQCKLKNPERKDEVPQLESIAEGEAIAIAASLAFGTEDEEGTKLEPSKICSPEDLSGVESRHFERNRESPEELAFDPEKVDGKSSVASQGNELPEASEGTLSDIDSFPEEDSDDPEYMPDEDIADDDSSDEDFVPYGTKSVRVSNKADKVPVTSAEVLSRAKVPGCTKLTTCTQSIVDVSPSFGAVSKALHAPVAFSCGSSASTTAKQISATRNVVTSSSCTVTTGYSCLSLGQMPTPFSLQSVLTLTKLGKPIVGKVLHGGSFIPFLPVSPALPSSIPRCSLGASVLQSYRDFNPPLIYTCGGARIASLHARVGRASTRPVAGTASVFVATPAPCPAGHTSHCSAASSPAVAASKQTISGAASTSGCTAGIMQGTAKSSSTQVPEEVATSKLLLASAGVSQKAVVAENRVADKSQKALQSVTANPCGLSAAPKVLAPPSELSVASTTSNPSQAGPAVALTSNSTHNISPTSAVTAPAFVMVPTSVGGRRYKLELPTNIASNVGAYEILLEDGRVKLKPKKGKTSGISQLSTAGSVTTSTSGVPSSAHAIKLSLSAFGRPSSHLSLRSVSSGSGANPSVCHASPATCVAANASVSAVQVSSVCDAGKQNPPRAVPNGKRLSASGMVSGGNFVPIAIRPKPVSSDSPVRFDPGGCTTSITGRALRVASANALKGEPLCSVSRVQSADPVVQTQILTSATPSVSTVPLSAAADVSSSVPLLCVPNPHLVLPMSFSSVPAAPTSFSSVPTVPTSFSSVPTVPTSFSSVPTVPVCLSMGATSKKLVQIVAQPLTGFTVPKSSSESLAKPLLVIGSRPAPPLSLCTSILTTKPTSSALPLIVATPVFAADQCNVGPAGPVNSLNVASLNPVLSPNHMAVLSAATAVLSKQLFFTTQPSDLSVKSMASTADQTRHPPIQANVCGGVPVGSVPRCSLSIPIAVPQASSAPQAPSSQGVPVLGNIQVALTVPHSVNFALSGVRTTLAAVPANVVYPTLRNSMINMPFLHNADNFKSSPRITNAINKLAVHNPNATRPVLIKAHVNNIAQKSDSCKMSVKPGDTSLARARAGRGECNLQSLQDLPVKFRKSSVVASSPGGSIRHSVPVLLGKHERLFAMVSQKRPKWTFLANGSDVDFLSLLGLEFCVSELSGKYFHSRYGLRPAATTRKRCQKKPPRQRPLDSKRAKPGAQVEVDAPTSVGLDSSCKDHHLSPDDAGDTSSLSSDVPVAYDPADLSFIEFVGDECVDQLRLYASYTESTLHQAAHGKRPRSYSSSEQSAIIPLQPACKRACSEAIAVSQVDCNGVSNCALTLQAGEIRNSDGLSHGTCISTGDSLIEVSGVTEGQDAGEKGRVATAVFAGTSVDAWPTKTSYDSKLTSPVETKIVTVRLSASPKICASSSHSSVALGGNFSRPNASVANHRGDD